MGNSMSHRPPKERCQSTSCVASVIPGSGTCLPDTRRRLHREHARDLACEKTDWKPVGCYLQLDDGRFIGRVPQAANCGT